MPPKYSWTRKLAQVASETMAEFLWRTAGSGQLTFRSYSSNFPGYTGFLLLQYTAQESLKKASPGGQVLGRPADS